MSINMDLIRRINYLARKQRYEGLTEQEREQQQRLRRQYRTISGNKSPKYWKTPAMPKSTTPAAGAARSSQASVPDHRCPSASTTQALMISPLTLSGLPAEVGVPPTLMHL